MSKLKLLVQLVKDRKRLRVLLSFNNKGGYLDKIGWFNAFENKEPLDEYSNPIPWVTYSFIDFIKERLIRKHLVFEFGSGNSTYFYAQHAGKVVSVEHDRTWYSKLYKTIPENAELIFCELVRDGDYCRTPARIKKFFDIIIVDGRDRVNCCIQAVNSLTENGVIVLDDSERDLYKEGISFLISNGFKQLSFSGISPGLFYRKTTSVFYKPNNCLDI
jgi:hypothetical protein